MSTKALPSIMRSLIVGSYDNKKGCDRKTGCFVNMRSSIERSFEIILNIPRGTIKDLIKKNLSPEHFIRQKNGYNVKAFFDPVRTLDDELERTAFTKWINDSTDYIESMHQSTTYFIDKLTDNDLSDSRLLREYIVFNSYTNYKVYLNSNIELTYDDLSPLLQFEWFNKSNVVVLNFHQEDKNTLTLRVPFQHSIHGLNETTKTVSCIFEDEISPGLIVRNGNLDEAEPGESEWDTSVHLNKVLLKSVKDVMDQNKHLKNVNDSEIPLSDVKTYVIDSNFRCCGVILKKYNLFVPYSGYHSVPNDVKLMYLDRVNKLNPKLSVDEIEKIYKEYEVVHEIKKNEEGEDYIELKDLGKFTYMHETGVNKFSLHNLISIAKTSAVSKYIKSLLDILDRNSTIDEALYYLSLIHI